MSISSVASSPELHLRVTARPENAGRMRAAMREFLEASALSAARCYDVLIAVGEAASNAIEHAYRGEQGEIRLFARLDARSILVEIQDGGTWRLDGDPERGRGLGIMRALMDSVEIVSTRTGTLVRLSMCFEEVAA